MMRGQLSALAIISSIFMLGCKGAPGKGGDSSGNPKLSGGGAAHVDSLKIIGTGVNGESANSLDAKDTLINGHSVTAPTDSGQKKKPGSIK
jgi:hypothetical protein